MPTVAFSGCVPRCGRDARFKEETVYISKEDAEKIREHFQAANAAWETGMRALHPSLANEAGRKDLHVCHEQFCLAEAVLNKALEPGGLA